MLQADAPVAEIAEATGRAAAKTLRQEGTADFVPLDVADPYGVRNVAGRIAAVHGVPHILVNNAGIS